MYKCGPTHDTSTNLARPTMNSFNLLCSCFSCTLFYGIRWEQVHNTKLHAFRARKFFISFTFQNSASPQFRTTTDLLGIPCFLIWNLSQIGLNIAESWKLINWKVEIETDCPDASNPSSPYRGEYTTNYWVSVHIWQQHVF